MRLFGKVDGTVDRYERASWLTLPFDLALSAAAETPRTGSSRWEWRDIPVPRHDPRKPFSPGTFLDQSPPKLRI